MSQYIYAVVVICLALCASVSEIQDDASVLRELQLRDVRTFLELAGRVGEGFRVSNRSTADSELVILRIDLGDGGRARIDESSGRVYEFMAPTFHIREDLKADEIATQDEAFNAVIPILKLYGLPAEIAYYKFTYSDNAGCFWTIQSELPSNLSGRPASLTIFLTADKLELRMLWYLPPLALPSTEVRVTSKEAADVVEQWLIHDTPFTRFNPRVLKLDEIVQDVVRGRQLPNEEWSREQLILKKEIHLCWGIPFTWDDQGYSFTYRGWVDVETGEIIATNDVNAINR
jgi:hypothetical protein